MDVTSLVTQRRVIRLQKLIRLAQTGEWRPLAKFLWPEVTLDWFQERLIDGLFDDRIAEVYIKGNTGCGKGGSAGLGIALYFITWPDARVVITSNTFDHALDVLYTEVCRWLGRMSVGAIYHPTKDGRIVESRDKYICVANPMSGESFSGRHGRHTLFVFDEASGVPEERYGLARTQCRKLVCLSNPRTTSGPFFRAFPEFDRDETKDFTVPGGIRRCITVGAPDCINVREKRLSRPISPEDGFVVGSREFSAGEPIPPELKPLVEPIIPGQTTYDTFLALKANTDPRYVDCFVYGRFPREDADKQLIYSSWLRRAAKRWRLKMSALKTAWPDEDRRKRFLNRMRIESLGLDLAASEFGDTTVLTAGNKNGVWELEMTRFADTMSTVGWVMRTAREKFDVDLSAGGIPVGIDAAGMGIAVCDRLAELGVQVVRMLGNETPQNPRLYTNARAERYAWLADRLDPHKSIHQPIFSLPDDEMLLQELAAVEKIYQGSDGFKFGITPKRRAPGSHFVGDAIEEKLGRSPDRADSVVYCYAAAATRNPSLEEWIEMGALQWH